MIGYIQDLLLTRGDAQTAWLRCLPLWHSKRGIDDWRPMVCRPFYTPSREVRLARRFAKRHYEEIDLILKQTQDNDPVTALCAMDLLCQMGVVAPRTIPSLINSNLPIGESLKKLLTTFVEDARQLVDNPIANFDTVGSYFRWQFESESWPPGESTVSDQTRMLDNQAVNRSRR